MPLTLSYLDLNRFMARRMAKWRTVPRLVLLTVVRGELTAQGNLAHTCLRTTAGFSWYRKANRQKARGELDLPFHHLSMELLTKCPEAGLDERRDPSPINGVQSTWFSAVERQETGWFLAHTPVGPSDGGSTKRAIKIRNGAWLSIARRSRRIMPRT
jgi:hypothetical protein